MIDASAQGNIDPGMKESPPSLRSQAGSIILMTSIFFLNVLSRIILAPLMPAVEKNLGLNHAQAGSVFLYISVGYFVSLTMAGSVSSRLTHRKTIIVSAVGTGIALIMITVTTSFVGMCTGMLILGVAAGLYLPSGIATLTDLVDVRHWGKALAIHELGPNLSFTAGPLISEALLLWFSWSGILAVIGGASIIAGVAFAWFGKGGKFNSEPPAVDSFRAMLQKPVFWVMIAMFSLALGGNIGIYTMLPLYLVTERGMDRHWGNSLVGLSRLSGLMMAFVAGWAADRFGPKHAMGICLLLTGTMTVLMGSAPNHWMVFVVFLQSMLAVCFFPAGFAALSRIAPANLKNTAVSLTLPFAFLTGAGAVAAGIGAMGDAGHFGLGIALFGALMIIGFPLSFYSALPGERMTDNASLRRPV